MGDPGLVLELPVQRRRQQLEDGGERTPGPLLVVVEPDWLARTGSAGVRGRVRS